jgi:hypothetical protein
MNNIRNSTRTLTLAELDAIRKSKGLSLREGGRYDYLKQQDKQRAGLATVSRWGRICALRHKRNQQRREEQAARQNASA